MIYAMTFEVDPRIQRYIDELNRDGFGVYFDRDVNEPYPMHILVCKNENLCRAIMRPDDYAEYVKIDYVLRVMVRNVENKLKEADK